MFPLDVVRADPNQLLRVPGIGPLTVKRIVQARVEGKLKDVGDFLRLGRVGRKSLDYVSVNGKRKRPEVMGKERVESEQIALSF